MLTFLDFEAASRLSLLDENPWINRREKIRRILPPNLKLHEITPDGDCFINIIAQATDNNIKQVREMLMEELCWRAFNCDLKVDFFPTDYEVRTLVVQKKNCITSKIHNLNNFCRL